jgi:prophage regulatory protein
MKRILRLPAVQAKTGLKHSKIYEEMAKTRAGEGDFPLSVPLGPKAVGWIESEVDEWIDRRIAERNSKRCSNKNKATDHSINI